MAEGRVDCSLLLISQRGAQDSVILILLMEMRSISQNKSQSLLPGPAHPSYSRG